MRNLTIKREKAYAASLTKVKVYIEDAAANELTINGTLCRKLGDLKNGEEKTFSVGEEAAKVYVIADKLSKEYSNDFYQLPEGTEDVRLTGRNKADPGTGNGFVFDANVGVPGQKKKSKTGWIVLAVALLFGAIAGKLISGGLFSGKKDPTKGEPTQYQVENLTITMPKGFEPLEADDYNACYYNNEIVAIFLKESFAEYAGLVDGMEDWTVEDYAELAASSNGGYDIKTRDGIPYFTYEADNEEAKEMFTYLVTSFKEPEGFWMVQFACPTDEYAKFEPSFFEWAKSVQFAN